MTFLGKQARNLTLQLARREIVSRHKGTYGGLYWYVIQNLLMLALYSFVFSAVFKSRWMETGKVPGNYTVALFIGLITFNIFSEVVSRSPTLVLNNANYVKKIVFPLHTLSIVQVLAALFNAFVATLVLLVVARLLGAPVNPTGLWLPVIVLPLAVLTLGVSWLLAAIGTYVRDVNQLITMVLSAVMFLSPLFYPISTLPKAGQLAMQFNPITIPMMQAREVLMFGQMPDFMLLGTYTVVALVVAYLGYVVFNGLKKGFSDVL